MFSRNTRYNLPVAVRAKNAFGPHVEVDQIATSLSNLAPVPFCLPSPLHPFHFVRSVSIVSHTVPSSVGIVLLSFLEAATMSAQAVAHLPPTPPHEPAKLSRMATSSSTASKPQHKHIWVITGPAGCGKTSVAEHLHSSFQFPYLEGDTVSNSASTPTSTTGG